MYDSGGEKVTRSSHYSLWLPEFEVDPHSWLRIGTFHMNNLYSKSMWCGLEIRV